VPEGISGEFQLFLVSGRTTEAYPHKISFNPKTEQLYTVEKKMLKNGTEIILSFSSNCSDFCGTVSGKNIRAWEGDLPNGVSFTTGSNKKISLSKNVLKFEIKKNDSGVNSVRILVDNPDVRHIEFAVIETGGRWRNNSEKNYSFYIGPGIARSGALIPSAPVFQKVSQAA
jgi:hypothetical protein